MIKARERALIEMPESAGVREKMRIEAPVPGGLITAQGEETRTGTDQDTAGGEGESLVSVRRSWPCFRGRGTRWWMWWMLWRRRTPGLQAWTDGHFERGIR